jgi:hypothetical protein
MSTAACGVSEHASGTAAGAVVLQPSGASSAAGAAAEATADGRRQPKDNLMDSIRKLKEQQAVIKAEKQRVAKELKNACKRRNRLKKRARQLTDVDLVEVLQMRKEMVVPSVDDKPTAVASTGDASPAADDDMRD